MAELLVTGGAGFIGTNFVRYWRRRHAQDRITALDALTYAGNAANLTDVKGLSFIHGDICDYELVRRLIQELRIDTIVHFAAESHVDRSIQGPDKFIETNIVGTHVLLKAAKAEWLERGTGRPHRFHHVSTDEVFGSLEPDELGFSETARYRPNSPYSASKAASDHLVRAYHHTYGLQTSISNCSNNYGPYQFPEKLIPLFLINTLLGKPLPIYGDGQNVRDWLHVDDHCHGIDIVIQNGRAGQAYNIGGGSELPNLAVVDQLCAEVDDAFAKRPALATRFPDAPAAHGKLSSGLKAYVADRKGHDRRYAIDSTKIRRELGFAPANGIADGLRRTINWYFDNEPWWRAVMSGGHRDWSSKYHFAVDNSQERLST